MSELKFASNSNLNLSKNSYSSRVKEGIPIFQEANGGNNFYNNYVDPFKMLENSNNINNFGINNLNMNISDVQTRKLFEKEMNPYLLHMKNELNLIIEKFRKEMSNKSQYFNEMSEIKQELIKSKQNSENNYLNIEQKILNINDVLNTQEKKMNNLQNELFQINHMNKKDDDIFLKNDIENIKNRVIIMETNNDKYLQEKTQNLEKIINYNLDKMNRNIDFLKEEINSIKGNLSQNNLKIEMMSSENNKKTERLNDFDSEFNNISNQINKIMINNNKILNSINVLEINGNEIQQKMKNINEKISVVNENIDMVNQESKSQKENIFSNKKYLSELESNLNLLQNEKNSINNKIIELNIKLENQEEKLSKNNNIINNSQFENNNMFYKDMTSQVTKVKKIMDDMQEKYDKEVSELKNNLNQFDIILKNNPFFNMNETERISILFKKEQVKFNDTFREQLKLLNEELKKIKNTSQFDKNNLEIINKNFKKHTKDINMLEQSLKSWTQIAQVLTKNYEKLRKDSKFNEDKNSNNNINFNNINGFEDSINKIQKYINNNKNDVYNLQQDIKEINDKTIPDVYKYINDQLNKLNKLDNNIIFENKIPTKTNKNNIITNKENNFIDNNIKNNFANNNQEKLTGQNLEDLASKIELMGSTAQNFNTKFNDNNNKNQKFGINSSFSHSLSDDLEKKDVDMDYINKIIEGDDNNNSKMKKNEFDSDFDN